MRIDADEDFRGVDLWCDLLCPDCSALLDDIESLRSRVELRLRHFPLVSHVWAVPAAHLAEEARTQGVLWPVVGAILAANDEISSIDDLIRLAVMGGADETALRRALADSRHRSTVSRDYVTGRRRGIRGVPTLVVHGPGDPVPIDASRTQTGVIPATLALADALELPRPAVAPPPRD